MATEAKVQTVGEFGEVVGGATSVVLSDFSGLDVAAVSDLRRKCRAAGVQYRVIKNTLAKRSIANTPLEALRSHLDGPNAWAVHKTDPVAQGGWNIFHTSWAALDMVNPAGHVFLRGNGKAAAPGWPDSPGIESLRNAWFTAPSAGSS